MTLKIFSNRQWKEFKEIYCWSMKQRFGIMILYMVLLFMALPMILLLALKSVHWTNLSSTSSAMLGTLVPALIVPLTLLFVLIFSVMLYHYMHQKRSVDYFHSLPAGRIPLLLGKYFAGLTMLYVPLTVNFGIVAIILQASNFSANNHGITIPVLHDLLWVLLMAAAAFSFSVLMAVCSGTTMDMVISAIIINISYPILIVLCQALTNSILPGLDLGSNYLNTYTIAFAPFAAAFMPFLPTGYSTNVMGTPFTIWWILLTLVMVAASLVLYRKRKSESAENTFAFPLPKIIIRFVATAAVGLGLGMIFIMLPDNNNQINFFLGVTAGSLITHIIAEVIYSRGFKTLKKSFVYYGAFVVLFLAAYLTVSLGCFGYDTRVPAASDIKSISYHSFLTNDFGGTPNGPTKVFDENGNEIASIEGNLTSSENVERVRTLHQNIIDAYRQNNYPYKINTNRGGAYNIAYHLKNGRTVTRSYNSYEVLGKDDKLQEYNSKIADSEEFKQSGLLINYLEPSYIQEIRISSDDKTGSTIDSGNDIKLEIINAIKQDMMSLDLIRTTTGPDKLINTSIEFDFHNEFEPTQGSPLKKLIGNYSGKVHLSNPYTELFIPATYTHTWALIKKYGWIK